MGPAAAPMRVLLLVLLVGCGSTYDPGEEWVEFTSPWVEFTPPAEYRAWFREVESCCGAQRPFEDIVWRKVFAFTIPCGAQDAVACLVFPNTIYLVDGALRDQPTVRGEMVHYVRQYAGHDDLHARCVQNK